MEHTWRLFASHRPPLLRMGALTFLLMAAGLVAGCADSKSSTDAWAEVEGVSYKLVAQPMIEPLAINTIHDWRLVLQTPKAQPVSGAQFKVSGGMPAHNHGLPTAPRVTAELQPGVYRLEGMKFQMGGQWEVQFDVEGDLGKETLTIAFEL